MPKSRADLLISFPTEAILYHSSDKSLLVPSCSIAALFPLKYRGHLKGKAAAITKVKRAPPPPFWSREREETLPVQDYLAALQFCLVNIKETWKFQRPLVGNPLQVPLVDGFYLNNSTNYNQSFDPGRTGKLYHAHLMQDTLEHSGV